MGLPKMCLCVCIYIYIYVCVCVCMCIYIYIGADWLKSSSVCQRVVARGQFSKKSLGNHLSEKLNLPVNMDSFWSWQQQSKHSAWLLHLVVAHQHTTMVKATVWTKVSVCHSLTCETGWSTYNGLSWAHRYHLQLTCDECMQDALLWLYLQPHGSFLFFFFLLFSINQIWLPAFRKRQKDKNTQKGYCITREGWCNQYYRWACVTCRTISCHCPLGSHAHFTVPPLP